MEFARLIKAHRRRTGKSQTQLADSLGISRGYLSSIERGKATNLSFALGVKLLNLDGRHGQHRQIEVTLSRKVYVDAAIALEVVWLNEVGVETVGSCAGPPAAALIMPSSVKTAKALGYSPLYKEMGLFEIRLKSGEK